jgi:putative ABC transport system permease protein
MKNIWMLAAANLRKQKGQTVSLLIFVFIAVMLLNIGLVITLRIEIFFHEQAELNHTAHLTSIYKARANSIEEGKQFLENHSDVNEIEMTNAIGGYGNYYLNGMVMQGFLIFSQVDKNQKMDPPTLMVDSLPLTGNAIYIPYTLLLNGAYQLGDTINFILGGKDLHFTIAGATKEIMFGSQTDPFFRIYLSDENYHIIKNQFPNNELTLLSARIKPKTSSSVFAAEYGKNVSSDGLIWSSSYDMAKSGRINFAMIAAYMIVTFSMILLIVSLIVIRFRIINSIEDSMINIGVQKAIGYRSIQIMLTIVLQFALIAFVGGIFGVAILQVMIPIIMKIWKSMLGLIWIPQFDFAAAIVSISIVLFTSIIVSLITSHRINALHPLIALRRGLSTHSWNKNYFPLDNMRAPLNLLLALKIIMQNKKQTISISLIVAVVTIVSFVGITFSYNLNERRMEFARSIFGEIPSIDVLIMLNEGNSGELFKNNIMQRYEVRKVFGYTGNRPTSLDIDGSAVLVITAEDCSLLESDMMIEGRYPKHNNEIALGTLVLKAAKKKVGDTVIVGNGKINREYLVTGIVQTTEGNGFNGLINGDGMRLLKPDFNFLDYAVYLHEDISAKIFIEHVQATEGNIFEVIIDEQNQVNNLLDSISGLFFAVTAVIGIASIIVIILVLYMTIKTAILQRRKDLGIQKAFGFTSFQLMNQIALNMTPIILLGILTGEVIGILSVNKIIIGMLSSLGISKLQLVIPVEQTIILSAALLLLAYVVSMLIAWRIRKISAYTLVTE